MKNDKLPDGGKPTLTTSPVNAAIAAAAVVAAVSAAAPAVAADAPKNYVVLNSLPTPHPIVYSISNVVTGNKAETQDWFSICLFATCSKLCVHIRSAI